MDMQASWLHGHRSDQDYFSTLAVIVSLSMNKKILLLVDDDADWLLMLEAVMLSQGYRVLTAGDSSRAMEVALRNRPQCVIADIHLAGEDGAGLCRRIKASPGLNNMPVIMLSGCGDACPDCGCDALLCKSDGMDRIIEIVRKAVYGRAV